MEGAGRLALLFGLVALLAGCGSSHPTAHRAAYSGCVYSIAAVRTAFAETGLRLHPGQRQPGVLRFHIVYTLSNQPAGRAGTLVVATRRSAVGSTSLPGHKIGYANVSVFTVKPAIDEVWGALSALRWGTTEQVKPGAHLIVPGKSIGPIWLGEPRKEIERTLGPGKPVLARLIAYLGGRITVSYTYHDSPTTYAAFLVTTSPGFHTHSGVHVGSSPRALRSLFARCGKGACSLLEGPWPDALGTGFYTRHGRVTKITIGYA